AAPHLDPAGGAPGGAVRVADGAGAPAGGRPDRPGVVVPERDLAGAGDGAGAGARQRRKRAQVSQYAAGASAGFAIMRCPRLVNMAWNMLINKLFHSPAYA